MNSITEPCKFQNTNSRKQFQRMKKIVQQNNINDITRADM